MAESFLIWSCNKRKFMKIIASEKGYKERLGSKLNSVWYICIDITREYSEKRYSSYPMDDSYYTKWTIQILREHGLDSSLEINAKLVSNTKVLEDKNVHFSSNSNQGYPLLSEGAKITNYTVDCVLRFKVVDAIESVVEEQVIVSKLKRLADDFQDLLIKGHFSDVTLKCGDDVINAHKFVLSARSPVFEAMFATNMQENVQGTLAVKDVESSIFRADITFLYSGQIKITSLSMACDLLYVAEKYQIKELKEGCVEYLKSVLNHENAVKILQVSDLYDSKLKTHAINFVKENFDELKNLLDWEDLTSKNAKLALEVYSSSE